MNKNRVPLRRVRFEACEAFVAAVMLFSIQR